MNTLEILFWSAAALTAYTYVGYPLLVAVLAQLSDLRRRADSCQKHHKQRDGSVSILLCVHNEEKRVRDKLEQLTHLLAKSDRTGEILLISDGSTDGSVELARPFGDRGVRVIEIPEKAGKATAQSLGCAEARYDILVFCDVRQRWAPDALDKLLRHFSDPHIGAVSGDLVVEAAPGVMAGIGLYWNYEKWIRRNESRIHSLTGVTGAICAVRRELFSPVPAGTLLDDVYWPMCVVMKGYRVVHDTEAMAFDTLPDKPAGEFARKVRTLTGNYQLLTKLPDVMLPWRNPVWVSFVSHKLLRLAVPWLLILMLICSAFLDAGVYRMLLSLQIGGYCVGIAGLIPAVSRNLRVGSAAASFLVLNAAAGLALWVWLSGRADKSWRKVQYTPATVKDCH